MPPARHRPTLDRLRAAISSTTGYRSPHANWFSGGIALCMIGALLVCATVLGTWSSLERTTSGDQGDERGRLQLSKARLDTLAASAQLEADLDAGVPGADALATFAARRAAIEETLTEVAGLNPELVGPTGTLRAALEAVPTATTASAARIRVGITRLAMEIDAGATQSPLRGELGFVDRAVSDVADLQVAGRLIEVELPEPSDHTYGLALASHLNRSGEDSAWSFGIRTMSGDVPAAVRGEIATLTTSDDARIVQDATSWAASRSGYQAAGAASRPDLAVVSAANDRLRSAMSTLGGRSLDAQVAHASAEQVAHDGRAGDLLAGVVACLVGAAAILVLRRRRSQISDDELRAAASTDRLTGLGNRTHLDVEVALLAERSPEVVLMHIDLDHFKPVNDTYGHAVGDRVLQLSAERLRAVSEAHDGVAARLGGDEFVLVLPSLDQGVIDSVTQSLLQSLQSFQIGGLDLAVGASIGVARGSGEVTDLLINADLALYQAKRTGRGQASTFRADAAEYVNFVRDAVANGQVQVVYQPQIALRDGRCIGTEVLARLLDDRGSLVPAKDWLGIVEWLGVTGELFEHVVSAVAADIRSGPPVQTKLWFNVAPNDLIRPGGSDWILEQLSRLGLPVSMIGIELTETEAITDPTRLAAVLERLRSVGLALALDDFGARNTPIGHLVDLPVTRVKLDASLISGISEDMPPNAWVVKAMAELATRLRIEVIAEGVTSGHQVSMLAKLGVPAAQGYLLGLPGPMDRIPGAVNIRALLHSSLNGIENHGGVGPLVQMSGNRAVVASAREHVARSEVGDRRRDPR